MITGTVNARHEVFIRLPVRNATGQEQEIETILDTGFTGSLPLPASLIAQFDFPWISRENATLANGAVEQFDVHDANVIWDGVPRPILVQAIDTSPLLGMALLIGYDLRVRVIVVGLVRIEAIP